MPLDNATNNNNGQKIIAGIVEDYKTPILLAVFIRAWSARESQTVEVCMKMAPMGFPWEWEYHGMKMWWEMGIRCMRMGTEMWKRRKITICCNDRALLTVHLAELLQFYVCWQLIWSFVQLFCLIYWLRINTGCDRHPACTKNYSWISTCLGWAVEWKWELEGIGNGI